jgi:galactose mutarotase-like enzyme
VACYPFHFEIKLKFIVHNGKWACHQIVKNTETEKPMPYYAGFHPYFLTPEMGMGKEKVVLNFHPIRRLKYNDTLTDIIGTQPVFKTPVIITDPDINEQLCVLGEDRLATLTFPNGDVLKTNVHGMQDPALFSYMQLYNIPEKPFFCVERWMSFPNALNTVSGVRWLNAGESEEAVFEISV